MAVGTDRDAYWNDFIKSGRVEDYLRYAGYEIKDSAMENADEQVKGHAGVYHDNGDGAESRAYGGI